MLLFFDLLLLQNFIDLSVVGLEDSHQTNAHGECQIAHVDKDKFVLLGLGAHFLRIWIYVQVASGLKFKVVRN
jgi:hypothetical protein